MEYLYNIKIRVVNVPMMLSWVVDKSVRKESTTSFYRDDISRGIFIKYTVRFYNHDQDDRLEPVRTPSGAMVACCRERYHSCIIDTLALKLRNQEFERFGVDFLYLKYMLFTGAELEMMYYKTPIGQHLE